MSSPYEPSDDDVAADPDSADRSAVSSGSAQPCMSADEAGTAMSVPATSAISASESAWRKAAAEAYADSSRSESPGQEPHAEFDAVSGVSRYTYEEVRQYRRRQFRTSVLLFVATFISTFLVGSSFVPLELPAALLSPRYRAFLDAVLQAQAVQLGLPVQSFMELVWQYCIHGLEYAVPLMTILLCHEMGHYLQSVRYGVPASFPYFIPLPLPPLGTMGAVILQGRGVANRRQMFDIAVTGPLAGLAVTIPILVYGISTSRFEVINRQVTMEFGEPLLLTWMIEWIHGATPEGKVMALNGYGFAGWVGVFITAMNLLPIGQLDGGHILYTLIGRSAHYVALLVIAAGGAAMLLTGTYSYILLLILLMLTGARHPPTANDNMPLGRIRSVIGWLTLAFLIIGFTPQPIIVPDRQQPAVPGQPDHFPPAAADPELVAGSLRGIMECQDLSAPNRRFAVVFREDQETDGAGGLLSIGIPPQYL